ncbi:urease accessory protein UreD [Bradyrhizobium sp.]|uniref:urease accessory protein UreD n=1 Tax=Bradyrhizobium sp. TaxID=376 RepID=UPI0039E58DFE
MSGTAATERGRLLDLSFVRRGGRTVIDRRLFAWPFVLTRSFHVDEDRPERLSVIVQTGSGAVHGEDSLAQRLALGPGTAVCLTGQGATSVHRAAPAIRAREVVRLHVDSGASLEYLPEPRILFPDAALSQLTEIDCEQNACALITDAFTMHDPAGHDRCFRELESTFCLRRSSREPVLIDRTRLQRPDRTLFRGHRAFGAAFMMLTPSHDLATLQRSVASALTPVSGLYAAASLLPDGAGIGVRLAALDLRSIRDAFARIQAIYLEALWATADVPVARHA